MTQEKEIELIIGNSGRNFSGGTSITIQLLQYQNNLMKLAILGSSYMPKNYKTLTYLEFLLLTRKKLSNGKPRVFSDMTEHSICQPGLPKPHGESQPG